jgi:hypothetical protein
MIDENTGLMVVRSDNYSGKKPEIVDPRSGEVRDPRARVAGKDGRQRTRTVRSS